MIFVTHDISLLEDELEEKFVQASGPGGQNVNKVATAVQLRFDAAHSPALSPPILERLRKLAGRRMNAEGVIVITARQFRTQERNRKDARNRLVSLIRDAAVPPVRRRPTRPSRAARERRIERKKRKSLTKKRRAKVGFFD